MAAPGLQACAYFTECSCGFHCRPGDQLVNHVSNDHGQPCRKVHVVDFENSFLKNTVLIQLTLDILSRQAASIPTILSTLKSVFFM